MASETLTFANDDTPLDLLLFRRYHREVPGLAEAVLTVNPGLATLGPRPPAGTRVIVPTPVVQAVAPVRTIRLYD